MRASILGSDGNILCQVNAIRDAFESLGHEHIVDMHHDDSAFTFVGNPPFNDYIDFAKSKSKKIIFNVLDIPWHVPEIDTIVAKLKEHLPLADKVTTISKAVQRDLKQYCDIDSDVIYYPMKPVKFTGEKKYPQFRVAMVGRLLDPNKYAATAIAALINAGFYEKEIAIVGPEYVGWGTRLGLISDEHLNDIYNSVDYVVMLDQFAGIGLPAVEAACCGAIPIIAPHLATFDELWVQSPLSLHYQKLNNANNISELILSIEADKKWKEEIKQDLLGYSELFFRPKFEAINVAKRIIDVYHSI